MSCPKDVAYFPSPARLRPDVPLWAFGLEGPWLCRRQGADLLRASSGNPRLSDLAEALALWNFERHPLDSFNITQALAVCRGGGRRSVVPPRLRTLVAQLGKRLQPPPEAGQWPDRREAPDPEAGLSFLRRAMAENPGGLYWPGQAFRFALSRGLAHLAWDIAGMLAADAVLAPIGLRLAAEATFAWDGPRAGLAALGAVDRELFPRFCALARGDGLLACGEVGEGLAVLRDLWRHASWHPGLTRRLRALVDPSPGADLDALPGRLFVFLYSWNRAALLDATLASLAQSRLGPARIMVLDNGSTDDTPLVLQRAGERFGPDRLAWERLPVNVGAPAARNWLAASAGLGPHDLAAYVDDDVTLPPDWLERLAGALLADPRADVAGARILAGAPGAAAGVQTADVHLLPPDAANAVRPLVNCGPGPDFGLGGGVGPCPSVSGCCHLLRGRALAGPAPFDIRFSPSQFDDFARDLGSFLRGNHAVFVGSLGVSHHQHAGPGQIRSGAALGQLLGARRKLDSLYAPNDMAAAAARDLDMAWADLEAAWERLCRKAGE